MYRKTELILEKKKNSSFCSCHEFLPLYDIIKIIFIINKNIIMNSTKE